MPRPKKQKKHLNQFHRSADIILERRRLELIDLIRALPDDEIVAAYHLFNSMTYPNGKILSPYIVNKAKEFVIEGLYKQTSSVTAMRDKIKTLEKENKKLYKDKETTDSHVRSLTAKVAKGEEAKARYIGMIRSIIQKRKTISPEQLGKEAEKLIKTNKKEYTPQFVKLATEISNTGHNSISSTVECMKKIYTFLTGKELDESISRSTVSRWNKEVAKLSVLENLCTGSESRFFTYGVMADESTRGEKKVFLVCFTYWNDKKDEPTLTLAKMVDLDRCTGIAIANTVIRTCEEYNFDPKKCNFWLTDNTAYMSGSNSGAIVGFNLQSQARAYRIPCGAHSVHIAVNNFESEAFGKTNSPSGSLFQEHPSSILNLAYHLHDGYKDSDKDNPANMKSETIRKLYWTLLQYRLNQYQKPISSRWLYQLKTGEQYLERKEIHFKFASWFVPQLEYSKNVPQNYIKKWKTFLNRLQDPLLNIQIKCMVKFGQRFYAEVFSFLTGYDATPRVLRNGILAHLPPGNRAHELPDQVLLWLGELQEAIELPGYYFADELEEASSMLPEDKFQNLCLKLKLGIKKASESFSKWMECWIHLPLSICRLGGDHGPEFARAVVSVIMNRSSEVEPSWREKSYIEFLEEDYSEGKKESFGLFEALKEDEFSQQFLAFAGSQASDLSKFPLVYDFVKYRIWSVIVHQQQIEGMFNKYDIKTDPNQEKTLQEARMQLTCSTSVETTVTRETLKEVRKEFRKESEKKEEDELGEEAAKIILKAYIAS